MGNVTFRPIILGFKTSMSAWLPATFAFQVCLLDLDLHYYQYNVDIRWMGRLNLHWWISKEILWYISINSTDRQADRLLFSMSPITWRNSHRMFWHSDYAFKGFMVYVLNDFAIQRQTCSQKARQLHQVFCPKSKVYLFCWKRLFEFFFSRFNFILTTLYWDLEPKILWHMFLPFQYIETIQ